MILFFYIALLGADGSQPIIRLDQIEVEGSVRRPPVTSIEASRLDETTQKIALNNLIRLEKQLLTPRSDAELNGLFSKVSK